jgi:hypothetical protein
MGLREGGGSAFTDYYRCPEALAEVGVADHLSQGHGYFSFGGAVAFGRCAGVVPARYASDSLAEVVDSVRVKAGVTELPFDFTEVVTNLREERYRLNGYSFLERTTSTDTAHRLYYLIRPLMGVGVRKHLQKLRLKGWDRIAFPQWPVDVTVERLMEGTMAELLQAHGQPIPFIWFWPDGATACSMLTHDVEGEAGLAFCERLMDLDDAHAMKSAFQIIPESNEATWRHSADKLRGRGFEVNLHDLNHDGLLFADRQEFLKRAKRINQYAREFGCDGFRSGAMYREQSWFDAFEFSYDMSVPNAAHLEPQRGGCCTVMPYFIGDILELPLTTSQDYTLFHILNDYSTTLWKKQIKLIVQKHGLISVITHPDYLLGEPQQEVYKELLEHLAELRDDQGVWAALPGQINEWWRNRHQMTLVAEGDRFRIEGRGSERARVAYATLENERVVYAIQSE